MDIWWYQIGSAGHIPATYTEFKNLIIHRFVHLESSRRTRDRLRRLEKNTSVSKFISDFRNIILIIVDMTEGETLGHSFSSDGLNYEVRIEFMKSQARSFEEKLAYH